MRLNIVKAEHNFFITMESTTIDRAMARLLNLSTREYQDILRNHGAFQESCNNEYYFNNKEDAQMAVDELESILVMNKLMK